MAVRSVLAPVVGAPRARPEGYFESISFLSKSQRRIVRLELSQEDFPGSIYVVLHATKPGERRRSPLACACSRSIRRVLRRGSAQRRRVSAQLGFMWTFAQAAKVVNPPGTSDLAAATTLSWSGPKYVCAAKYWNICRISGAPG